MDRAGGPLTSGLLCPNNPASITDFLAVSLLLAFPPFALHSDLSSFPSSFARLIFACLTACLPLPGLAADAHRYMFLFFVFFREGASCISCVRLQSCSRERHLCKLTCCLTECDSPLVPLHCFLVIVSLCFCMFSSVCSCFLLPMCPPLVVSCPSFSFSSAV